MTSRPTPAGPSTVASAPRRRSPLAVRWRQFRNAPRPVFRAVASSLVVAVLGGLAYLAYDLAVESGRSLPGGDLRLLFLAGYVVVVLAAGSLMTWLLVPQPTGSGTRVVRSPWSAALGLFAAIPVCYLVLVVLLEVLKPVLTGR